MYSDEKIYNDTVEIVKCAVGSSSDNNWLTNNHGPSIIELYIKSVFNALKTINAQCKD